IFVSIVSLVFAILFYLSRFKRFFGPWLYTMVLLAILSIVWILNGGIVGSINYIFLLGLMTILLVSKKGQRYWLLFIYFFDITALYVLDYMMGNKIIVPYSSKENHYNDMTFVFLVVIIGVFFILDHFKQSYDKERDKVKEKTKELERANEERLNAFITLTHEIRTPITIINNYLQEYIEKYDETEEITIIKDSVDKLTKDISNSFIEEKFTKGTLPFEHDQVTNLSKLIIGKEKIFKGYAWKKEISFKIDVEDNIFIKADPGAVDSIINNLVENAIKYTPGKGNISLTLFSKNEHVYISVKDNGNGIPRELQDQIFVAWYQIAGNKQNSQGVGMGLSIVNNIVKSLKGKIKLNSKVNEGTEFIIELKKYELKEKDKLAEVIWQIPLSFGYMNQVNDEIQDHTNNLLIIEDNLQMLQYLVNKLKNKYNVYVSTNGKEALDKLTQMPVPNLIISDVMMDDMDGFTFLETISKKQGLNHVPFIFLTAKTTHADKLKGLNLGAIDYFHKPFLINELMIKIESIINNYHKQKKAFFDSTYRYVSKELGHSSLPKNELSSPGDLLENYHITPREKEIIKLLVEGKTYKTIGKELFISEKTVTNHVQNIYEKTGVNNKAQLIKLISMGT
ncbi:MAG: ATP-binding protein, partial [bacterium]